MNFLSKIKFVLNKPKVVIVVGNGRFVAKSVIVGILGSQFKVGKDILIIDCDNSCIKDCL